MKGSRMQIWPGMINEPTALLVQKLARGAIAFIGFGGVAGACFAVGTLGGTLWMQSFQWHLCGLLVSLILVIGFFGNIRVSKIVLERLNVNPSESQPGAAPNCGPAASGENSIAPGGPPSVS